MAFLFYYLYYFFPMMFSTMAYYANLNFRNFSYLPLKLVRIILRQKKSRIPINVETTFQMPVIIDFDKKKKSCMQHSLWSTFQNIIKTIIKLHSLLRQIMPNWTIFKTHNHKVFELGTVIISLISGLCLNKPKLYSCNSFLLFF